MFQLLWVRFDALAVRHAREALEDLTPPGVHLLAESVGGGAEAFEMAMLEVHPGLFRPEYRERNLDLRDQLRDVLEFGVGLPCGHESPGRVPRQNLSPRALAAVFAEFVPTPASPRLDDAVLERRSADVVFPRPPKAHVVREDAIGPLGRGVDEEGLPDGHFTHESVSFSAAA